MWWLVEGTIVETPYMGEDRTFEHRTLVQADTAEQAELKYQQWWDGKTREYATYYRVQSCGANETIT